MGLYDRNSESFNLDTSKAESRISSIENYFNNEVKTKDQSLKEKKEYATSEPLTWEEKLAKAYQEKYPEYETSDTEKTNKAWDGKTFAKASTSVNFNEVDGKDVSGPSSSAEGGEGVDALGGGIAVLNELPSLISNFSDKPRTQGEANSKTISGISSGAKIGLAFGGPVGAGIGVAAGFLGAKIAGKGWRDDIREEKDSAVIAANNLSKKERMATYVQENNIEKLQAERDAYAQALGYSPTRTA